MSCEEPEEDLCLWEMALPSGVPVSRPSFHARSAGIQCTKAMGRSTSTITNYATF